MPRNVISELKNSAIARPTLYEVHIEPLIVDPGGNTSGSEVQDLQSELGLTESLILRCENAVLPSKSIATTENRIYGPIHHHPYQNIFQELVLQFIADKHLHIRRYFDYWMNYIVRPDGNLNYKRGFSGSGYEKTIRVGQLDEAGQNCVYAVEFQKAFPKTINEVNLSYGASNDYMKQQISFVYHKWIDYDPTQFQVMFKNESDEREENELNIGDIVKRGVKYGVNEALRRNVDNRVVRDATTGIVTRF